MYPINIPVDPAQHGGYVPYFYHAGLHYSHGLPESVRPGRAEFSASLFRDMRR